MCKHTDGIPVISMNVHGRLIKSFGEYYLSPHGCYNSSIGTLLEQFPLIIDLIKDVPYREKSIEIRLDGNQHLMFKVTRPKEKRLKNGFF